MHKKQTLSPMRMSHGRIAPFCIVQVQQNSKFEINGAAQSRQNRSEGPSSSLGRLSLAVAPSSSLVSPLFLFRNWNRVRQATCAQTPSTCTVTGRSQVKLV